MTIAAVLFDLDGVLVDSGEAWYQVVRSGCVRWGYAPVTRETFRGTFGQGPEADRRQFFFRHTLAEVMDHYRRAFADLV